MKNGSELVWSMWEWERRIECTPTCPSIDRAWESEPASRAIVPLISRHVIRHSRLSPPYPPRTWISIYRRDCIPADAEEQARGDAKAASPLFWVRAVG